MNTYPVGLSGSLFSMTKPTATVSELHRLADEYEAKAKQLRAAAELVASTGPGTGRATPGRSSASTDRRRNGHFSGLSEADYLNAIRQAPQRDWTAETLAEALRAEGHNVASEEAVRTALYRMARSGRLEKSGRGTFRLSRKEKALAH